MEDEGAVTHREAMAEGEYAASYEDTERAHALLDGLVAARRRAGLTQADVAQRMGVAQSAVPRFETEGADPRLSTIQRYARVVGVVVTFAVVANGD